MKDFLDKISSYNLFNYLLPGILFTVFAEHITAYKIMQSDIIIGLFLYYFCGLVISRIGSLILEPTMKKVSFVTFASYKEFARVSAKDPSVETLSESNNMYRTLCALFLVLLAIKPFEIITNWLSINADVKAYILFALLFVLFALSYRKQTKYITQRIEAEKDEHS
ncbi:MAG: hypothetical protein KKD92_02300 [Proteobacteria bacterium]|nr:hypothetical protein [Pseudomonadota bacterium]